MWGLAIVDPPLENAECGRCPRKAEIRPLEEPEVTRIRQKTTPQSATPKKDRKNRKETREKEKETEMRKTKDILLEDLTHLYKTARRYKKFDIALKVKKLQAQIGGLLITKPRQIPKLDDLTDDEINEFLLANPC